MLIEEFFTFFLDDIYRINFNHCYYVYIKKKYFPNILSSFFLPSLRLTPTPHPFFFFFFNLIFCAVASIMLWKCCRSCVKDLGFENQVIPFKKPQRSL